MAGDKIDTSGNSNLPIIDLLSAFLNAPGAAATTNVHGIVTSGAINMPTNITGINSMVTQQGNQSNASPNKPRAFINVIFFNEQFKTYDGGFSISMVGSNSILKDHYSDLQNLIANKSGYVYIYCSNESPVDVFFDNLQVRHTRGEILEETHYYPFGLTMAGISLKAAGKLENKNEKFQEQPLDDDLGLNWYGFKWRNHDPQIGRFIQIDPLSEKYVYNSTYAFSENHVIAHRELEGLEKVLAIFFHGGADGGAKTTTPEKAGGAGVIYNDTKRFAESTGREFAGTIIAPGFKSDNSVNTANDFIKGNYEKGDQVIIYGYSYGGDAAVELSKSLNDQGTKVNLLVTVDNSDGIIGFAANSTVDTKIPGNVETNLNVYQNEPAGKTRANGEPNTAKETNKTMVLNKDVSSPGTTHGNIQQKSQTLIESVINFTIQQLPIKK